MMKFLSTFGGGARGGGGAARGGGMRAGRPAAGTGRQSTRDLQRAVRAGETSIRPSVTGAASRARATLKRMQEMQVGRSAARIGRGFTPGMRAR